MAGSKNQWFLLGMGFVGILILGASLFSLPHFPPTNYDEYENAVMGHDWVTTGQIRYPLMKDVVQPEFEALTASNQGSLRGTHMALMGTWATLFGEGILSHRFSSWLAWLLIGVILFLFLKELMGLHAGLVAVLLWGCSFDGLLASHLVRPDIWVGFCLVLFLFLALSTNKKLKTKRWLFLGLLAGLTPGLHPNGLILLPLLLFSCFFLKRIRKEKNDVFIQSALGLVLGGLLVLLCVDIKTFFISQNTYAAHLYSTGSQMWLTRLNPLVLLKESFKSFLTPHTFYVAENLRHPIFWSALGWVPLVGSLISCCWVFYQKPKNKTFIFLAFSFLLIFFLVGYGAFRKEIVYHTPITLAGIPLMTWALFSVLEKRRKSAQSFGLLIFLIVVFSHMAMATWTQWTFIAKQTPSIQKTWDEAKTFVTSGDKKVLGPHFFWRIFDQEFRDVNALVSDYFYSGEKKPWEGIERFKPDILIVDDEIRRRFLVGQNPETKTFFIKPISALTKTPFQYLGSIPANTHHSKLDFYRMIWDQ